MLFNVVKKNSAYLILFACYLLVLYQYKVNEGLLVPYINLFLYFSIYLLIKETLPKTELNRELVVQFMILYFYLSIFTVLPIAVRNMDHWNFVAYVYFEIILKFLIFSLALSIAIMSVRHRIHSRIRQTALVFLISIVLTGFNYSEFIWNPELLAESAESWSNWQVHNYVTMVGAILLLLVFWYRYYLKRCVVSEYLNLAIFIFTLSNISEAIHFVAFQNNIEIFISGQTINLILNIIVLVVWYIRLTYLNKPIAMENERYLKNFHYLNGLVPKPTESIFLRLSPVYSFILMAVFGIIALVVILFLINKITLYLMMNSVLVLIAVLLALYLGFSSIKREWNNSMGMLFNDRKKK